MVETKRLKDAMRIRAVHDGRAAEVAATLRVLGLEQMPAPGRRPQHLAGGGNLKPFGSRLSGSNAFGSSHSQFGFEKMSRENTDRGLRGKWLFGRPPVKIVPPVPTGAARNGLRPGAHGDGARAFLR